MSRWGRWLIVGLSAACIGCPNSRTWGRKESGPNPFDATKPNRDRSTAVSGDADDPFLRSARAATKDRRPAAGAASDDPLLQSTSDREPAFGGSPRTTPASGRGIPPAAPVGDSSSQFRQLRDRIDRMKGKFSSEKLPDSKEYLIRCEVPSPVDPELIQMFEARDASELKALTAVVRQAEQWLGGLRRKSTDREYDPYQGL